MNIPLDIEYRNRTVRDLDNERKSHLINQAMIQSRHGSPGGRNAGKAGAAGVAGSIPKMLADY